jgi:hypothetical protein
MGYTVEWTDALQNVSVSGIISFFIFFIFQVFWGDQIHEGLQNAYDLGVYVPSTLIIFTGIIFVFAFGTLIQLIAFESYLFEQKLISSLLSIVITLTTLFFISWLTLDLTYVEQKTNFEYFITIFSIYHLPSPVYIWFITLFIFHISLAVCIKLFYVKTKPT